MKKIELVKASVTDNTINYVVCEDPGLGLLQQQKVELFVRYYLGTSSDCGLSELPLSILLLPITIYMLPITYFYNVELVVPEMDKDLFDHLGEIYEAYSKIYGPFKEKWRGKITVGKVVENKSIGSPKYDKIVFFSGGVDACLAGINNPGRNTLLVSIPDIEIKAKNDGPLREEKFALIKNFGETVDSDWLLIANNFNACLFRNEEIQSYLNDIIGLSSPAFKFDGWHGVKYTHNMCCVAPVAFRSGTKLLIMGSSCETIDGCYTVNLDGANPDLTNSFRFANISFAEQDGLYLRRSQKVRDIINGFRKKGARVKLWACFEDRPTQCCFCLKCVRTELNILCVGENPKEWGFDDFDENAFSNYIRGYKYVDRSPCWLWDIIDSIDDQKAYPYLNDTLHWLKKMGYKEYILRVERKMHHKGLRMRVREKLSVHPRVFAVLKNAFAS